MSKLIEIKEVDNDCLELKTSTNFIEVSVIGIGNLIINRCEKEIPNAKMV